MKNVVITGATSMIGLATVKSAINAGINVTAVIRQGSLRKSLLPMSERLTVIECGLNDYDNLTANSETYDALIHLAWAGTNVSTRNDLEIQVKNIEYELKAIHLAKKWQCKKFIGIGSQAEYGQHTYGKPTSPLSHISPESGYGIAKYASYGMSRVLSRELGIEHCWIRVFSVYGEHDRPQTLIMTCIDAFLNNKELNLTKCEQLWDYIYVDDVANAIIKVADLGKNNTVYCLGSGECNKLKFFVETIRGVTSSSIIPNYGMKEYFQSQPMYLCADINNLMQDTGFRPKYNFREGIVKTVDWYRDINREKE